MSPVVEPRMATLLEMVASLEDAIVRLEEAGNDGAGETIRRLRLLQRDILAAIRRLEGDEHSTD
jgi:hypothetical protein